MVEVHCEVCGTEMVEALDKDPHSDYLVKPDGRIVFPCPRCTTEQDSEMLELSVAACRALADVGGQKLA